MTRANSGPALLVALAIAGLLAVPAAAQQFQSGAMPVTIAQFEQILESSKGARDADLARKLSGVTLTERAGSAQLSAWQKEFPGKRTREVLIALSDLSAFRTLPATDLPSEPPPPIEMQRTIFARAVDYVVKPQPRLPDFSAQRSTTRFEIASRVVFDSLRHTSGLSAAAGEQASYRVLGPVRPGPGGGQWLYISATSSHVVTYRDGSEVTDKAPPANKFQLKSLNQPLSTVGEFGPILGVVIGDSVHSSVTWSHWERDGDRTLAILKYAVPASKSHYEVLSSALGDSQTAAYHGEIAVDPETGTIYRIMLLSDPGTPEVPESAIVVDYGPMEIAGQTYTCPIRSIALSRTSVQSIYKAVEATDFTSLNDVTFTNYHVFRTKVLILPETGAAAPQ